MQILICLIKRLEQISIIIETEQRKNLEDTIELKVINLSKKS